MLLIDDAKYFKANLSAAISPYLNPVEIISGLKSIKSTCTGFTMWISFSCSIIFLIFQIFILLFLQISIILPKYVNILLPSKPCFNKCDSSKPTIIFISAVESSKFSIGYTCNKPPSVYKLLLISSGGHTIQGDAEATTYFLISGFLPLIYW